MRGSTPPIGCVGAVALLLTAFPVAASERSFAAILEELGVSRAEMKVGAEADWLGHPQMASVPFVLPHLEVVHRDPMRLLSYGQNLRHVAAQEDSDGKGWTRVLSAFLLTPRLPGFRGISPKIDFQGSEQHDLSRDLAEAGLPEALLEPVSRLGRAVLSAAELVDRSWDREDPKRVAAAVRTADVPRLLPGASVRWPELGTAAEDRRGDVERASALMTIIAALERATPELESVAANPELELDFGVVELATSFGRLVIAGSGSDFHDCRSDCLLLVDVGGDDRYRGSVAGASMPGNPVAVSLDLSGDDRYTARGAAQGAALGGVGVLVDQSGDDHYISEHSSQGYGLLGYGVLIDSAGNDQFQIGGGGQGAGIFGGGALLDDRGDDQYRALGEAQAFGGPWGVGALVDSDGHDLYRVEPDPEIAVGRDDYHSNNEIAASNAQGVGIGRRGDLTDGQVWAGGLGVLADLAGNDTYEAGNFAQGLGYWYGTGLLIDGSGDDLFRSTYFSQGSGAHFSAALLFDGGGADRHELTGPSGASLGYGWDFALSLFVDGGGSDVYRSRQSSLGVADRSSLAVFLELSGDDVYELDGATRSFGAPGAARHSLRQPNGPLRAAARASRIGLFLDLGGKDRYPDSLPGCPSSPSNGLLWRCLQGASVTGKPRFHGGWDLEQPISNDLIGWILGLN